MILAVTNTWEVRFEVRRPLPALPRPRRAALSQAGAGYRSIGRLRRNEGCSVLQLTLAGEGRFSDARGERRVGPGEAFLCRVDDPAVAYGHPGGSDPWSFVFLAFYGGGESVDALVARDGPVWFLGRDHPAAVQLLALRRFTTGRPMGAGAAALLVHGLLAALADGVAPDGAGHRLVEAARAMVRAQPGHLPGVSELATKLGVTREHLARAFDHELGESPRDWIAREKMRLACQRLRDSREAIAVIALDLGYPNPSRFDKVFKRMVGCTPGLYRSGRFVGLW